MPKIPFFLVTGFLGSGKTTLLKRYLEKYSEEKKIAIIQNEFAEINIDSRELKNTGNDFVILEMNNGSVFCICLLGDFVQSLNRFILEHRPDIIILEASGLSDPISICQVLSAPALKNLVWLAHTYTVVDTLNFRKTIERVARNTHQIRVADTIIMNKCDLTRDSVTEIEEALKELNPFARMIRASYCRIDFTDEEIFKYPTSIDLNTGKEFAGKPDIESQVIKTTRKIPRTRLLSFIGKWSQQTYRMKGYVQTNEGAVSVQTSFEHSEIVPLQSYNEPTQMVILGNNLKNLQKDYEDLCRN